MSRQREPRVKFRCTPSAELSRQCVLSGGTQLRALPLKYYKQSLQENKNVLSFQQMLRPRY